MASLRRALPRSRPPEASENDPDGLPDPAPLPPPRSPLVCIPDPSQSPRKGPVVELIVPKVVDHSQLWTKGAGGTPRSAQSTPTRGPSRVHYGNVGLGSGNGGRLPMHGGGRERGSSSRAVRAMADVRSCPSAEPEVRHFELDEDPSFWNDHNVQVLIRIRPINSAESALQGQGRCLRQESAQTLTWTGHPETRFTFDHIVCDTISQAKLFKVVGVPMVENCMSGYNSCMFAYGQTGSGKTHTMMGEIREMDDNPCEDRGMTPRIFEYLFARIREEEENRKNENLKYSCKCSYLEIYNEQITDLLEPSSTNLQLREDVKKGVYVENLKEHDVDTVKDVIELLLQGTANRKMAATSMNSESSRSHSVFTCNIESQWEKDSMRHIRFGRLNLVDLAGSERQKSSGAEGERLKEAANINRSLSTLGLVIMTLVDIANGKHRHVPYRDSRLTFLLQDSLGGNSKTTIIANVSPSICSANETLSTLKFAQRAKLIQNNAKVNEDASGDVMALQLEIQRLKDQLNIVTKHQNIPGLLFSPPLIYETANVGNILDKSGCSAGDLTTSLECSSVLDHKMPFLKSALASSLRREKMTEAQIRSLEAENEHMKQLVLQMEADIQRTKMMLHLRDETIRSLELQADGLLSGDEYLMEKNNTLTEEIQLLQEKIDKNPELTRIELENIKLLQELKVLQDFHEKGGREILLNEISQLRNELLNVLKGKCEQARLTCRREIQVDVALHEDATPCIQQRNQHTQKLIDCSDKCMGSLQTNDCFTREVNDLHCPPKLPPPSHQSVDQSVIYCLQRESQMMPEARPLPVELTLVNNVLGDRIESLVMSDEVTRQQEAAEVSECGDTRKSSLQATLGKTQGEPQAARSLYMQFQNEHYSHLSQFYEMEKIREQVEVETAQTILNLQQELAVLQQELCSRRVNDLMDETPMILRTENEELKERLLQVTDKNAELLDLITAKDAQINVMTDEWERAVIDLTSFLLDGCQSLEDASDHIYSIIDSFPQSNSWIGDHVERAMKIFIEKERLIVNLQKSLEDAQKMSLEMASKLNSLKVATLAITEVQQIDHDETTNELLYLQMLLNEKTSMIQELENTIKCKDDEIIKAEKQSNAAFIAIKRLNEITLHRPLHARADMLMIKRTEIDHPQLPSNRSKYCQPRRSELPAPPADDWKEQIEARVPMSKLLSSVEQHRPIISEETKLKEDELVLEDIQVHIEAAMRQIFESENELVACCRDTQNYLASLVSDTHDMHSSAKSFLQQMIAEIHYMKYFIEVIEREVHFPLSTVESAVSEAQWAKPRGPCLMMQLIQNDLTKANERLRALKADIERLFSICRYILKHENLAKMSSIHMPSGEDNLILSESDILHLRDGLKFSFDSLAAAHDQLTVLVDAIGGTNSSPAGNYSYEVVEIGTNDLSLNAFSQMETQVMCYTLQDLERRIMESDANCTRTREVLQKLNDGRWVANEKTKQAASLFLKFEEAHETMKEADLILNELIRANETAKLETERWKQTSHVMQKERASLAAEVEQMRNAIVVDEELNQMLKGEVNATITEMPKLLSELEEMFQIMQNHTKSELKAIHSDIFSFASEIRECIRVSKAWFETLFSEIIWENFPSCMLQQHHVVHEITSFNLGTNPVRSLDVDSSSIHRYTEKYFPHVMNSLRFRDEVTKVRNGRDEECELSDLGGTQKALNTFQNSLADIVSNADSGNFQKLDALCAPNDTPFQIAKLEKDKMDLIKDMNLVKGAISNKVTLLDQFIGFIKKQSPQHQSYECTDLHFGNECTTVNILVDQSQGCDTSILSGSSNSVMCMHPKLQWGTIYESRSVANDDDAPRQDDMEGATIDIHNLLNSIQQLRAQCAKLMQETENKKSSHLTFLGNKIAMLRSAVTTDDTNTEHGNHLMQAVNELGNNLAWLSRWLCPDLDAEIEMDIFPSILEMLFQGLSNLEEKTCKFIGRQSINVIEQNGNLASSLSPKTESDQKDALFRSVHSGQVLKESISTDKDIKYEEEEKTDALSNVQNELAIKITQVDAILQHQRELDSQLADSEAALSTLRSELKDTKDALAILVKDNKKLVLLLEDINRQKMDAEEQLRDQEKVIHNLEREILRLNASIEERIFSSVEEIIEELRLVTDERDQLQKEFIHLNEKLDMASALADENEAIAIEARQDAEASKVYAEEREEEVKVLESSVEELEGTINVLEKKVYDMGEEVERYRLIRENLEQELQTLRGSVFIRAPASENSEIEDCIVGLKQMPRQIDDILMELSVSKKHINDLEKERAFQAEEIKRYKEHISEIVLHSEAQSSLYQQKFQALEAMVYEAKTNALVSNHTSLVTNKIDKTSMRQRGSGSPFRCISSLVQQMSSEKDQELSVAKHRIEELEVLASDRQKQVCMLSARLAAVDNMTHDVIRDLLEVKLDMTNYANRIDWKELQKLLENGWQENDQSSTKDDENLRLKVQINALIEEKNSWIEQRKTEILATQEKLEKLLHRDQLLTAQNEMLKLDKVNLTKKLNELDEMIKKLVGSQSIQELIQLHNVKESNASRHNKELARRLAESDKLLQRAKNELAWSPTCDSSEPFYQHQ